MLKGINKNVLIICVTILIVIILIISYSIFTHYFREKKIENCLNKIDDNLEKYPWEKDYSLSRDDCYRLYK